MYQIESSSQVIKARKGLFSRVTVSGTVLGLGWTSFFTDISAEMVTSILPIYLLVSLQLSPLQFGLLDGLQHGASALVRLIGGYVSDRWGRYKQVALVGYAISAIVRLGFLAAGAAWVWIAGLIVADRVGKGLRTAPRDALISLSTPPAELGTAFGVHRGLDTAGAMLGPVVAFALLAFVPGGYDAVFVVSFCIALIGLGVLWLFVPARPAPLAAGAAPAHAGADAVSAPARPTALEQPVVSLATALGLLRGGRFRRLVLAGSLLGLTTISDGFLYLSIQQRMQLDVGFFPLLFVFTALVYMLLAVPVGRIADRWGRARVFIGGYALLLVVYTLLLHREIGWGELAVYLALLGAYYAATDGVLMALASQYLPAPLRASGLALLGTAIGVARLLSSLLFGLFWTLWGIQPTVMAFFGLLGVSVIISALVVLRLDRDAVRA